MALLWLSLASAFLFYQTLKIIYRLYFHPLAKFPGPRFAAATKWYEAYFDLRLYRPGTFFHELTRLHKIYGPIVRINPEELHVDESTWVDTLYVMPARGIRNKYTPAALMAGAPGSGFGQRFQRAGFGTSLHDVHRKRRASMSPLFSKAAVSSMTATIYSKVELMLQNVHQQIQRQGFAELHLNWLAMNLDSLADSFLGIGNGTDLLKDEQKARAWAGTVDAVATSTPFAKQFTWFIPLASRLPMWVLKILTPEVSRLVKLRRDMLRQPTEVAEQLSQDTAGKQTISAHPELYKTILSSSGLDEREKQPERISQEGFVLLVAGNELPRESLPMEYSTSSPIGQKSYLGSKRNFFKSCQSRIPRLHGTSWSSYRGCTAMITLYIGFAVFFRRNDFILHDTLYERDIEIEQDCLTGKTSDRSNGVRVKYADDKLM
ncbi:hypothetical protein P171DRAFT_492339 [Karstenula rhodostoma CBS 690.94]|uniref:Cytochrome P450 n=1 Tax=Karstenula rhodostoma CBS 690.94 TaxID=1392251 RepID=A0A9P4U4P8_9PLEO|nr:hypothetical protein P171DRAFT_492339 [Karstenula rhodostoma CBS 690.94]